MHSLKSYLTRSFSPLDGFSSNSARLFLSLFSSLSLPSQASKERSSLFDYLNTNFKLSKSQSAYVSKRVLAVRCPQNPLSVLKFFQQIGFSEDQIQSIVRNHSQLIFSNIEKTLKPKIEFFQRIGFDDSELPKFISKNPDVLICSLNKTLVPAVEAIRKILYNNKDFIRVLHRSGGRILPKYKKVLQSAAFFENVGIVGSQLSILMKRQTWVFTVNECMLKNFISQAVDMGFHSNSKMLVHALLTITGLKIETLRRKLEFLQSFGFSKDESLKMFRGAPNLPRVSEKKLRFGIEFYLHTAMLPKSVLVQQPAILMYSMEDRVIPRYRVFQLILSKNLFKRETKFAAMLGYGEEVFLKRYIFPFGDNAEELLVAYKGHYLEAASKQSSVFQSS
ncbi:hypothetical protein L6164_005313 [Bauhinia variegata]|uniref:Uncharacterized protein n=1 Tax=Bauhinia variegata TaxID=167791 RepID=A0ACB9PPZ3_BAUVA|nr:hypothetical protein L6164_005313 [Bauhinia variegata]